MEAPSHAALARPSNSTEPAVVCKSTPPYAVVYANHAWERLCGFTSAEMLGCSLKCLQGPATKMSDIETLMESVRKREACVVPSLVNCLSLAALEPDHRLYVWCCQCFFF